MAQTMREFFQLTKTGEKYLGQDLDGQGLRANKDLANYHGLPIRVKIGYETVRVVMPDAEHVDHSQWPEGIVAMPEEAKRWAREQAAEYFAAHDQPCSCAHCCDHRDVGRGQQ